MSHKVYVIAGGEGTRWGNYLGVPKHEIKINGEELWKRSLRLLGGGELLTHNSSKSGLGVDKFYQSEDLWNKEGRTILVFGDVFLTEKASDIILKDSVKSVRFYGRKKGSKITGKRYGEIFAVSFYTENIPKFLWAIEKAIQNYNGKKCQGWQVWREIYKKYSEPLVEINDFTEDFDYPFDYDEWKKRYDIQ